MRKLYLKGFLFGCRDCHELTYASTQASDRRGSAARKAGYDPTRRRRTPGDRTVGDLAFALKFLDDRLRRLDKIAERLGPVRK